MLLILGLSVWHIKINYYPRKGLALREDKEISEKIFLYIPKSKVLILSWTDSYEKCFHLETLTGFILVHHYAFITSSKIPIADQLLYEKITLLILNNINSFYSQKF